MPNGDRAVATDESSKNEVAVQSLNNATRRYGDTSKASPPMLRLAKNMKIAPRNEALKMARTTEGLAFMVESLPHKLGKNRLQVARGIAETLLDEPICIMAINTSKASVTLPKNIRNGQMTETPSTVNPRKTH